MFVKKKGMANSDYVSTLEHSMRSPKKTDIHSLSSAKHLTDWQEPNTLQSWTSRASITTFKSGKETNKRRHSRPNEEHMNIESCHLDYATYQQHFRAGSMRPSWNILTCAALSTWTTYLYIPTIYHNTNSASEISSKQYKQQEWSLSLPNASFARQKQNT